MKMRDSDIVECFVLIAITLAVQILIDIILFTK